LAEGAQFETQPAVLQKHVPAHAHARIGIGGVAEHLGAAMDNVGLSTVLLVSNTRTATSTALKTPTRNMGQN
jgi:hypothetical protein